MIWKIQIPVILKNHQFMRLWGNQLLLQVAFNMCNYTALLILADRNHSPFIQAQFYVVLTLPAFLFGMIAGPIVDIVDRKKLMLVTDLLLAFLFLSYAFAGASIAIIMAIAFLTSSVARFFIPAEAATIPLIVSEETLEHANTFFLFTLMGSVLLGYAIAGPLVQFFGGLRTSGEAAPFILSSIFLFVGFVLRLSLKKIEIVMPKLPKGTIFKQTYVLFWQTIAEVKKNKNISTPLSLLVFVEFLMGILSITFFEYVRKYLELPLTSISYVIMGPLIIGLIFGVAFLGRIENKFGHTKSILIGCYSIGIILFLLGLFPFFISTILLRVFAVLSAFLIGIAVVIISVQARTILQINAKSEMHGRIFSFLDILIALVTPVPVLVIGFLADKISVLYIILMIGILIVAVLFGGVVKFKRKYARVARIGK